MAVKKLGTLIDQLYEAREKRLAIQRQVDALKEKERAAEERVTEALKAANLTKGAGKRAAVSLSPKTVAQVDPARWNEVFAWIADHEAFELLHKRINNGAFRERVADGDAGSIPGIKAETVLDLSVRAVK
jgi:hypothetical protein